MAQRIVSLTEKDARRLERHLRAATVRNWIDVLALRTLGLELQRARIVSFNEVMPNVVTMHSRVTIRDLATREGMEVTVVWPEDAEPQNGKVSVVSPVGAALLGYRIGDTVNLRTADGLRRIRIEGIRWKAIAAECGDPDGDCVEASVR